MVRFFRNSQPEPSHGTGAKGTLPPPVPRDCTARPPFTDATTTESPQIGTLLVVVDQARNLPNRKLLGKQKPYCAASLATQVLKTQTDRKGGQAPKW